MNNYEVCVNTESEAIALLRKQEQDEKETISYMRSYTNNPNYSYINEVESLIKMGQSRYNSYRLYGISVLSLQPKPNNICDTGTDEELATELRSSGLSEDKIYQHIGTEAEIEPEIETFTGQEILDKFKEDIDLMLFEIENVLRKEI